MSICKDCFHNEVCKYGENRSNGMYCTGEKCKQYKPTADAVEVRHGEWIFINQAKGYLEPPYGDTLKCSLCEFVIDVSEGNYKYCPHCGAKMDGEKCAKTDIKTTENCEVFGKSE